MDYFADLFALVKHFWAILLKYRSSKTGRMQIAFLKILRNVHYVVGCNICQLLVKKHL